MPVTRGSLPGPDPIQSEPAMREPRFRRQDVRRAVPDHLLGAQDAGFRRGTYRRSDARSGGARTSGRTAVIQGIGDNAESDEGILAGWIFGKHKYAGRARHSGEAPHTRHGFEFCAIRCSRKQMLWNFGERHDATLGADADRRRVANPAFEPFGDLGKRERGLNTFPQRVVREFRRVSWGCW